MKSLPSQPGATIRTVVALSVLSTVPIGLAACSASTKPQQTATANTARTTPATTTPSTPAAAAGPATTGDFCVLWTKVSTDVGNITAKIRDRAHADPNTLHQLVSVERSDTHPLTAAAPVELRDDVKTFADWSDRFMASFEAVNFDVSKTYPQLPTAAVTGAERHISTYISANCPPS